MQDVLFIGIVHAAQSLLNLCTSLNSGPLNMFWAEGGVGSEMQPSSAGQALCPAPSAFQVLTEVSFVAGTEAHAH